MIEECNEAECLQAAEEDCRPLKNETGTPILKISFFKKQIPCSILHKDKILHQYNTYLLCLVPSN